MNFFYVYKENEKSNGIGNTPKSYSNSKELILLPIEQLVLDYNYKKGAAKGIHKWPMKCI